jgi:hypothetical protein
LSGASLSLFLRSKNAASPSFPLWIWSGVARQWQVDYIQGYRGVLQGVAARTERIETCAWRRCKRVVGVSRANAKRLASFVVDLQTAHHTQGAPMCTQMKSTRARLAAGARQLVADAEHCRVHGKHRCCSAADCRASGWAQCECSSPKPGRLFACTSSSVGK